MNRIIDDFKDFEALSNFMLLSFVWFRLFYFNNIESQVGFPIILFYVVLSVFPMMDLYKSKLIDKENVIKIFLDDNWKNIIPGLWFLHILAIMENKESIESLGFVLYVTFISIHKPLRKYPDRIWNGLLEFERIILFLLGLIAIYFIQFNRSQTSSGTLWEHIGLLSVVLFVCFLRMVNLDTISHDNSKNN